MYPCCEEEFKVLRQWKMLLFVAFPSLPQDQICFANLVAGVRFERTTSRLCLPLQLSLPPIFGVRSLDYTLIPISRDPCQLVSTPSRLRRAWLGITLIHIEGFTEFDRFSIKRYRLRDPYLSLASYQAAPPRIMFLRVVIIPMMRMKSKVYLL